MTKKECAIVMAYTGITMLSGEDFGIYHRYIEDIMGRPVWTHELASESVVKEIKEKSRYDFLKLCESAKFSAFDDRSKAGRSQLVALFDCFRKRVSKHQEKVLDEDMIDSGTAVQILCDLLCELGVWDEGEQPEI
jgi:hypothetical protein